MTDDEIAALIKVAGLVPYFSKAFRQWWLVDEDMVVAFINGTDALQRAPNSRAWMPDRPEDFTSKEKLCRAFIDGLGKWQ